MFGEFVKFKGDYFDDGLTPVASSTTYGDTVLDVFRAQGQVEAITRVLTALTIGATGLTVVYESSANGSTGWTVRHQSDEFSDTAINALAVGAVIDRYTIPQEGDRYWRVGIILSGTYTGGTVESFAHYIAK
jgi:hypothetical protein